MKKNSRKLVGKHPFLYQAQLNSHLIIIFELPSQPSSSDLSEQNQSHSPHVSKPMMPSTNEQNMTRGDLLMQPKLLVYSRKKKNLGKIENPIVFSKVKGLN